MLGGILTKWYQSRTILRVTQAMAQKQMEERLEKNEDIRKLKDLALELNKRVERLAEELRENNVSC